MDFFMGAFFLLFHLLSLHPTDCTITPLSISNFRGRNSTFSCYGRGILLWHVDDVPLSYKTVEVLTEQGIIVESQENGGEVQSTLTVKSSRDRNNNNTIIKCVVITGTSMNSSTASLIIIDMTPVRLEYSESNPREFTLQWDKVYVPSNFTVLSYSIEITDESNKVLDTVRVTAASQETYEYSYMSGQSRSDLPECSRRAFSVFAETDNGNTERVEVVWEQPKQPKDLDEAFCSVVNTSFVRVEFGNPVCPFQAAAYTIVLSYKGKRVGSVLGKIEGNSVNKLIKSTLAIESSKTFEASVTVEGKPSTMKATCFEKRVTEAALSSSSGSADFKGLQIFIIIAVVLLTLAIVIVCILAMIVVIKKLQRGEKS